MSERDVNASEAERSRLEFEEPGQYPDPRTELQRHLLEVHGNLAAGNLPDEEVARQHWEEHNESGGLRSHAEPAHLHVWHNGTTDLTYATLIEDADRIANAVLRAEFVTRERPIRLLGAEPAREQSVPNDRPGAHDLLLESVTKTVRRRAQVLRFAGKTREADAVTKALTDVALLVDQRRELGLTRYGALLQAGNGRDSLRDAIEEVVDLAAYLVVWREARDEALTVLRQVRDNLAAEGTCFAEAQVELLDDVVTLLAGSESGDG